MDNSYTENIKKGKKSKTKLKTIRYGFSNTQKLYKYKVVSVKCSKKCIKTGLAEE